MIFFSRSFSIYDILILVSTMGSSIGQYKLGCDENKISTVSALKELDILQTFVIYFCVGLSSS